MKMSRNDWHNFKKDIIEAIESTGDTVEDIEAVKILNELDGTYNGEDPRDIAAKPYREKLISWAIAAPILDYEYDSGFGGMDCHDIRIWTKDNIFYIHEYDGSTSVYSMSRNPE